MFIEIVKTIKKLSDGSILHPATSSTFPRRRPSDWSNGAEPGSSTPGRTEMPRKTILMDRARSPCPRRKKCPFLPGLRPEITSGSLTCGRSTFWRASSWM